MTSSLILRQHISNNADEVVVFGADNFAQYPRRDQSIQSRCERALAGASAHDIVVLRGRLDHDYYTWLRSHDLGPDIVVEYKETSRDLSLSECIVKHPKPILEIIEKTGRKPVYVPWYSGKMETEAASRIGAELFGASGAATVKYNDKSEFKTICQELDIPVVTGHSFSINPEGNDNSGDMAQIIKLYLKSHREVIIRGTVGESGMSLYRTDGTDLSGLYEKIASTGEKMVIIEPFLSVISSPGDQWAIERNGEIGHLGLTDQICERGMVHVGTQYGLPQSARIKNYINHSSRKIAQHMAEYGYRGVLGIDYIVTADGIFPVENNARFNGSTYVRLIVDNIEKRGQMVNCWKFIKIKATPCSFVDLIDNLQDIIYDGMKQNSIFPYNCNGLATSGDLSVILLAEDFNHLVHLEKLLGERGVKRH